MRKKAAGELQGAIAQLSTIMSVYDDHRFITAISTLDIGELVTKKTLDVYEKTNVLHLELSAEIKHKMSERKSSDDSSLILDDIQERVEQVAEKQDLLLRPLSELDREIADIFQRKGIHFIEAGVYLADREEAIESNKLSAGEKTDAEFFLLQHIQRKRSYSH